MVENEVVINMKFEDCGIFQEQDNKELFASCYDKLGAMLQNYNSIEINIRLPRKEKDIFWKTKQILKKLQTLKGATYFDSRESKEKKLLEDKSSFFSSKTQYKNFLKEIPEANMEEMSKLILSSVIDSKNEEDNNFDFNSISNIQKGNSDKNAENRTNFLFKIEIKDYFKFQAFSTILKDEEEKNEIKFPGLDRYPLKILFKKGNKDEKTPHFIEFYEIISDKKKKIPQKQFFEDYINGLVYHRISRDDLEKINNKNIENFLMRIQEEISSLKYFRDKYQNLFLVAYTNKQELIRAIKEAADLKIFDDPIMGSVKEIASSSTEEEIIDFYKLAYVSEEKEFRNQILFVLNQYKIKNFQISKILTAEIQELSFKYEASEKNGYLFRLYYKEKIEKIQARCVYNIPKQIFNWIRTLVADIQSKYYDNFNINFENIDANVLIRIYYTPLYKNKSHSSIVILGSDSNSNEFIKELEVFNHNFFVIKI